MEIKSLYAQDAILKAVKMMDADYIEDNLYQLLDTYIMENKSATGGDIADKIDYIRMLVRLFRYLQEEFNPIMGTIAEEEETL